jgi:hypothetical protein
MASLTSLTNYESKIKELIEGYFTKNFEITNELILEINKIKNDHQFYNLFDDAKVKHSLSKATENYTKNNEQLLEEFKKMNFEETVEDLYKDYDLLANEEYTTLNDQLSVVKKQYEIIETQYSRLKESIMTKMIMEIFEHNYIIAALIVILNGFKNLISPMLNPVLGVFKMHIDTFLEKLDEVINKAKEFKDKNNKCREEIFVKIDKHFKDFKNFIKPILNNEGAVKIKFIIWFDKNINNSENRSYQDELKKRYSNYDFRPISSIDELKEISSNLSERGILITSGSSYKEVLDICYSVLYITDIIIFTFDTKKYMDAKYEYDKVSNVVNNFKELTNLIDNIIKGSNFLVDYLIPLNISKIPSNISKYINPAKYGFKSFDEVSLDESKYDGIVNFAKDLKISTSKEDIKKFLKIFKSKSNPENISKEILRLYTTESSFYRIVNRSLGNLDDKSIIVCENWIKSLKLALEIYDDNKRLNEIMLYRGINCNADFDVIKNYKVMMHIVFPAFTSTSSSKDVPIRFKKTDKCFILFKINYKINKERLIYRPKCISEISKYVGENEYLLFPLSIFIVKDVQCASTNHYCIELENLE